MTTLKQIELETIFLISIVAVVSLFIVINRNNQGQFNVSSNMLINSPLAVNPTKEPSQNVFSQISPDGSKKVIMKIAKNEDDTQTYSLYTADESLANEKFIFDRTLDATKSMNIPFNTFSPDNKYFFIEETVGDSRAILAFKVSGEVFSETEQYLDVTDLFKKKDTGNNFKEATGWASESLIIINTTGPSYWFEIPSRAIIQLSS